MTSGLGLGSGPGRGAGLAGPGDPVGGQTAGDQRGRHPDTGDRAAAGQHHVVHPARQVARPERPALAEGVRERERRPGHHALPGPVGRSHHVAHADRGVQPGQQPVRDGGGQLVGVAGPGPVPVDPAAVQVRGRGQDVQQVGAVRRESRVGGRRPGDQQRRIVHELPVVNDLGERLLPGLAERDRVMSGLGPGPAGSHVQHHRGRGRAQPHRPPRTPAQQLVGGIQLGGQHHRVARDPHSVGGADGRDPVPGSFQRGDGRAVVQLHPGGSGRAGQRVRHRAHPAAGEVHPGHGVHVGNDRVDGQRMAGRLPRVQRLEREHPPQPLVVDEPADGRLQAAERPQPGQPGQVRRDQGQRRIEVGRDELAELALVKLGQPGPQPLVPGRLSGPGERLDRIGHGLGVGVYVQRAAVGEGGPVGRVQPDQVEPVGQLLPHRGQRLGQQVGHGQHGGAGVEPVAAGVQPPGPATRVGTAFDDRDLAAAAGQVQRGGQAGQPRAHHHHVV